MKQNYQSPATTVVSLATESIVALSTKLNQIQGGTFTYGGGGSGPARVKDATEVYDVWDDDWSAE